MSPVPGPTGGAAPRASADSSSSRESSPGRGTSKKRSFSPDSEDDQSVGPPAADDTSPPPDQPVIRQGLAYPARNEVHTGAGGTSSSATSPTTSVPQMSSASPTPAPTASTPATSSPHLSATSTPSDRSSAPKGTKRTSKGTANKKAKHADDVSFTTGRFRIAQYSSTPNDMPPLHHGQGPYSSMYRAPVPSVEITPPEPSSLPPQSSFSPPPGASTAALSSRRMMEQAPQPPASKYSARTSKPPPTPPGPPPPLRSDSASQMSAGQSRVRPGHTIRAPPPSQHIPSTFSPPPGATPRGSHPSLPPHHSGNRILSSGYYRRNYEQDSHALRDHSYPSHGMVQVHQPPSGREPVMAPPPGAGISSKGKEREAMAYSEHHNPHPEASRLAKGTVRLVTALIEDKRVNPPDHLLAEVHIRCWGGTRPEELWCDAKDLSEALQASASRIDGPAKVFTKRGDYRQCFLRVTHEQEDKYNSMNLALAPDRTVHITVEHFNPPETARLTNAYDWRTMPWHGSQHQRHDDGRFFAEASRKRPAYSDDRSSPEYPPDSPRHISYNNQSGNATNQDPRFEAPSLSRHSSSGYPRKRSHVSDMESPIEDVQNMQSNFMDTSNDYGNTGYDSSNSDDIRFVVADSLGKLLRNDINFDRFADLYNSAKLVEVIQAYRMAEDICKKYAGRPLPMKGGKSHVVTEEDVARALHVSEPKRFKQERREMFRFLELYGEKGKRGENLKVIKMLRDEYYPDNSKKIIKQLQQLLQEVDLKWGQEHPPEVGGDQRSSRMT